jgi:hypothetical protein
VHGHQKTVFYGHKLDDDLFNVHDSRSKSSP